MNEKEVLAIHYALHNSNCTEVSWKGNKFPIKDNNKKNVRYAVVLGHKFMTQNKNSASEGAELAKKGHKVTWLVTTQPWGRIVDDKIDKWCSAFLKPGKENTLSFSQQDKNDNEEEVNSKSLTLNSNNNNSNSNSVSSTTATNDNRPVCKYGESCYRKNPLHFQQFAHPPIKSETKTEMDMELEMDTETTSETATQLKTSMKESLTHSNQELKRSMSSNSNNDKNDLLPNEQSSKKQKSTTINSNSITQTWRIDPKELQIGEVIGQGAFGSVKKGKFRATTVAIKVLLEGLTDKKQIELFQQENALLCTLRHPNIVDCLGVVVPEPNQMLQQYCMVMEYLPLDLKRLIVNTGGFCGQLPMKSLLQISKGIALGMNYLHQRTPKIIHRDLKPANILLDTNLVPKIADFGVSREKEETSTMTRIGTPHYMAPEILQAKKYSEKVDVYSFAMILYQLVSGQVPFSKMGNDQEELNPLQVIMKASIENVRPEIPLKCPEPIDELIKMCWTKDGAYRPAFDKIVTFFESLDDNGNLDDNMTLNTNSNFKTETLSTTPPPLTS